MGLNTNDLFYDVGQERVVFPIYYKGRIIDAVGRAVGKGNSLSGIGIVARLITI